MKHFGMMMTVRGLRIEIYNKKKGWFRPKRWCKGMENPIAAMRHICILSGYDISEQDEAFGECYLWAKGETTGVIIK